MTEPTQPKPNRGGRPPLPAHQPVIDSASCAIAISRELMGQSRDPQLRALHSLCKKFLAIEQAARDDQRNKLQAESNRIAREQLELKRDEYRRRRTLGIQRREASINSGMLPTPEESRSSEHG